MLKNEDDESVGLEDLDLRDFSSIHIQESEPMEEGDEPTTETDQNLRKALEILKLRKNDREKAEENWATNQQSLGEEEDDGRESPEEEDDRNGHEGDQAVQSLIMDMIQSPATTDRQAVRFAMENDDGREIEQARSPEEDDRRHETEDGQAVQSINMDQSIEATAADGLEGIQAVIKTPEANDEQQESDQAAQSMDMVHSPDHRQETDQLGQGTSTSSSSSSTNSTCSSTSSKTEENHRKRKNQNDGGGGGGHEGRTTPKSSEMRKEVSKRDTIFVGHLPFTMDDRQLGQLFVSCIGPVISAEVVTCRETGKSRGFGFVRFKSGPHADRAIARKRFYPPDSRTPVLAFPYTPGFGKSKYATGQAHNLEQSNSRAKCSANFEKLGRRRSFTTENTPTTSHHHKDEEKDEEEHCSDMDIDSSQADSRRPSVSTRSSIGGDPIPTPSSSAIANRTRSPASAFRSRTPASFSVAGGRNSNLSMASSSRGGGRKRESRTRSPPSTHRIPHSPPSAHRARTPVYRARTPAFSANGRKSTLSMASSSRRGERRTRDRETRHRTSSPPSVHRYASPSSSSSIRRPDLDDDALARSRNKHLEEIEERTHSENRAIFVARFSYDLRVRHMEDQFGQWGKIINIRVFPTAFRVEFSRKREAAIAIREMNGREWGRSGKIFICEWWEDIGPKPYNHRSRSGDRNRNERRRLASRSKSPLRRPRNELEKQNETGKKQKAAAKRRDTLFLPKTNVTLPAHFLFDDIDLSISTDDDNDEEKQRPPSAVTKLAEYFGKNPEMPIIDRMRACLALIQGPEEGCASNSRRVISKMEDEYSSSSSSSSRSSSRCSRSCSCSSCESDSSIEVLYVKKGPERTFPVDKKIKIEKE